MDVWDELHQLLRQLEEALLQLQVGGRMSGPGPLMDARTGVYNRAYLVERLVAETVRSQRSGRPFGLGLVRFAAGPFEREQAGALRSALVRRLEPMDVPVRYDDRTLLVLFPELNLEETERRTERLATEMILAGFGSRAEARMAAAAYPESARGAAELLDVAESRFVPLGGFGSRAVEVREPPSFEVQEAQPVPEREDGDAHAADARNGDAGMAAGSPALSNGRLEASPPIEPVAVGFAGERKFPVSFWYRGDLLVIDAILDDGPGEEGGRRLRVRTAAGDFELLDRGRRWLAQPLSAAD